MTAQKEETTPVTGTLLSLISCLHAARTQYIGESAMAADLNLPRPVDWWGRCKVLFFTTYRLEVEALGLKANAQTFRALMGITVPDEAGTTPFEELPRKWHFDPWAGQGRGGFVPAPQTEAA